jgi:hypothetical protein
MDDRLTCQDRRRDREGCPQMGTRFLSLSHCVHRRRCFRDCGFAELFLSDDDWPRFIVEG